MLNCVRVRISSGAPLNALVVKLVDTLSSDGSAFGVWVRIPSRAPDADMVQWLEFQLPKLAMRVRFPLSAPKAKQPKRIPFYMDIFNPYPKDI